MCLPQRLGELGQPGRNVPQIDVPVLAARKQGLSVGRNGEAIDVRPVRAELDRLGRMGGQVPEQNRAVVPRAGDGRSVVRNGHASDECRNDPPATPAPGRWQRPKHAASHAAHDERPPISRQGHRRAEPGLLPQFGWLGRIRQVPTSAAAPSALLAANRRPSAEIASPRIGCPRVDGPVRGSSVAGFHRRINPLRRPKRPCCHRRRSPPRAPAAGDQTAHRGWPGAPGRQR